MDERVEYQHEEVEEERHEAEGGGSRLQKRKEGIEIERESAGVKWLTSRSDNGVGVVRSACSVVDSSLLSYLLERVSLFFLRRAEDDIFSV